MEILLQVFTLNPIFEINVCMQVKGVYAHCSWGNEFMSGAQPSCVDSTLSY